MKFFFSSFISDQLQVVKDGKYGAENPNVKGGWDGIVGELVRQVSFFFKCDIFKIIISVCRKLFLFSVVPKNIGFDLDHIKWIRGR